MSPVLAGLWLLGGLFGGGGADSDCPAAAEAGARTMEQIAETWPLRVAGDPVRKYVQSLGEGIARTADPGGGEWRFFVVRNLEPTAFAVGGRRFVVSDGVIAFARNESDLVAVLAHEIAHQRLGHFCGAAPRAAERVRYGSIVQHFDLQIELQADAEAVYLLTLTGFDPGSMYQVLRCLAQRPGAPIAQLQPRLRALGEPAPFPVEAQPGLTGNFERIRGLVIEEAGTTVTRCR